MYRIGVDLGGTNIAAGIVNEEGKIIARLSIPTGAHRPADEIAADIAALCHSLINEAGIPIDESLAPGQYRMLTADEIALLESHANQN